MVALDSLQRSGAPRQHGHERPLGGLLMESLGIAASLAAGGAPAYIVSLKVSDRADAAGVRRLWRLETE